MLNERLQREALPSQNILGEPGKCSWFYSSQWIFTRKKMLLWFLFPGVGIQMQCKNLDFNWPGILGNLFWKSYSCWKLDPDLDLNIQFRIQGI